MTTDRPTTDDQPQGPFTHFAKISGGHNITYNSATRQPIPFVFGSRAGFLGTADRTAPFPVGSNPRWRPEVFVSLTDSLSWWWSLHSLFVQLTSITCHIVKGWLGGVVVSVLDSRSRGRGFDSRPEHHQAATLGKLLIPMCLCHQAVQFGTGQRAVMLCGREGNHRSGGTDFSDLSTCGLMAKVREMSTPPTSIWAWSAFYVRNSNEYNVR